jgi:hypothetical protein
MDFINNFNEFVGSFNAIIQSVIIVLVGAAGAFTFFAVFTFLQWLPEFLDERHTQRINYPNNDEGE